MIPSEQVVITIVLAVLCVAGAFYLFSLLKPKSHIQGDEMVLEGLPLEGESETHEPSTNEEEEASHEEEISSEENEHFKGIEETGLAILVRYRKSFMAKLIQANDTTKNEYSVLKNVLLSYKKVKSHISWNFDSIRAGRTNLA